MLRKKVTSQDADETLLRLTETAQAWLADDKNREEVIRAIDAAQSTTDVLASNRRIDRDQLYQPVTM
jgi:hypothetical protein